MSKKTYGTVIEISQNCGRIAVKLDNGNISVMDIYNPKSFEIGHIIYGQLDVLGGYFIFNKTTQAEYFAYVEASCCNLETAQQQLLLE
ncbi:hypothetical protein CKQ84_21715 [Shewanella sp. WE21]|uniref:hypothetical protein n=1 Tax=Shewanella TaxID=22 RepID=UPI000CF6BFB3|nr:hypothetical protein [Shewanella sp. WE21]AVI68238.1 hypothetical protein CKQ84_21715 [Shewanella sp. WE21]